MTDVDAKGISVLLVDDHPIVRQGYRRVLESQSDLHVVAEADNAADAYAAFKAHDPDVIVMDISMPGASGLEAIRNIRARAGLGLDQVVIVLHGLDAQIELRGDLLGRCAGGELPQDLDLPFAQLIQHRARR